LSAEDDETVPFVPASQLPKSHRPRPSGRITPCGICGEPVAEATDARYLNRVPGYRHRKIGIACDPCVKRIEDRRDANAERMRSLGG
jgi:hypothetical protein